MFPRPYFTFASPSGSKHSRKPSPPPLCRCTLLDAYDMFAPRVFREINKKRPVLRQKTGNESP